MYCPKSKTDAISLSLSLALALSLSSIYLSLHTLVYGERADYFGGAGTLE